MLLEIIFISLPSEVFLCVERTLRVPILFEAKEISQALSSLQLMVELSEEDREGGGGFETGACLIRVVFPVRLLVEQTPLRGGLATPFGPAANEAHIFQVLLNYTECLSSEPEPEHEPELVA